MPAPPTVALPQQITGMGARQPGLAMRRAATAATTRDSGDSTRTSKPLLVQKVGARIMMRKVAGVGSPRVIPIDGKDDSRCSSLPRHPRAWPMYVCRHRAAIDPRVRPVDDESGPGNGSGAGNENGADDGPIFPSGGMEPARRKSSNGWRPMLPAGHPRVASSESPTTNNDGTARMLALRVFPLATDQSTTTH